MTYYRIFKLNRTGRISGPSVVVWFDKDADVAAFAAGEGWSFGYEVWSGPRMVCRVVVDTERYLTNHRSLTRGVAKSHFIPRQNTRNSQLHFHWHARRNARAVQLDERVITLGASV